MYMYISRNLHISGGNTTFCLMTDDYPRLSRYADITRVYAICGAEEYYHKKARIKNIQIKGKAQNAYKWKCYISTEV